MFAAGQWRASRCERGHDVERGRGRRQGLAACRAGLETRSAAPQKQASLPSWSRAFPPTILASASSRRARSASSPRNPKIPDDAFMVKRLPGYSPDLAARIVYPVAFDALGSQAVFL